VAALREVHEEHRFYGVRRLAIHLGWGENKTRRIRTLAGVKVPHPTKRHRYKHGQPEISAPENALQKYAVPRNEGRPQDGMNYRGMTNSGAWVQDFTYINFEQSVCYLAVVLSLKTREVVGWRLGTNHSSDLTHAAVLDALSKHSPPTILHSDQGSEYLSYKHQELCERMNIQPSCTRRLLCRSIITIRGAYI